MLDSIEDFDYPLEITLHRDRRVGELMGMYEEQGMGINEAEKAAEREYDRRMQAGLYDGEFYD